MIKDIKEDLLKIHENTLRMRSLEESIKDNTTREEWVGFLLKRAKADSECYVENKRISDEIHAFFKNGNPLSLNESVDLLMQIYPYYQNQENDLLTGFIAKSINDVFKDNEDYFHYVLSLTIAYNAYVVLDQSVIFQDHVQMMPHLRSVLDIRYDIPLRKIEEKDRTSILNIIFLAYYNIITSARELTFHNYYDACYPYLLEMDEYKEYVKKEIGVIPPSAEAIYDATKTVWLSNGQFVHTPISSYDYFMETYLKYYGSLKPEEMDTEGFILYLSVRLDKDEVTKDDVLSEIYHIYLNLKKEKMDYLFNNRPDVEKGTFDDYLMMVNVFNHLFSYMISLISDDASYQRHKEVVDVIFRDYRMFYPIFSRAFTPDFISRIMSDMTDFLMSVLPEEAKTKWISEVFVSENPTAFIHFEMVSTMAEEIADSLYDENPSYFSCLNLKDKKSVLSFIRNAGLYHDLGKERMIDIISRDTMPLTDDEFAIIKKHPSYGALLTENVMSLKPYKDIMEGHHKWYNGKGGYPSSFSNIQSPLRNIIDIITICDCLDAATDFLGRNYSKSKSFSDVLGEFERDKGVRYSPYLVDFISGNERLKAILEHQVTGGRIDICYTVYDSYYRQ